MDIFHREAKVIHRITPCERSERNETIPRGTENIHIMDTFHRMAKIFLRIAACEWNERHEIIHRYTENIHIIGHISQYGATFS
jgi:hypothetical protein